MTEAGRITEGQRIAAEALIERAEVMGRPIEEDVLEMAREVLRLAEDQDRAEAQKPIGNPA